MTRVVLSAGLAALALVLGLLTALVQSSNRERGLALNRLKEECGMIETINGEHQEEILRRDWGPLAREPKPPSAKVAATTKPAPGSKTAPGTKTAMGAKPSSSARLASASNSATKGVAP
jgi:hypothetical protein